MQDNAASGDTLNQQQLFCCSKMAKQIKGGYLMRYRKKLFGKTWREEWVTLLDDSTLAWFKEKDRRSPEGVIVIKDAPEMMAVGAFTLRIPTRPELPSGCTVVQLMAFGTRRRNKVHWLLAKNEEEANDWILAIRNTLPPPPQLLKSKRSDSPPRLTAIPYCYTRGSWIGASGEKDVTASSNESTAADSEFVPASGLVLDHDLKLRSNWGHGWGWTCYNQLDINTAAVHVSAHYDINDITAYDGLPDVDLGDGDLNMTSFLGDFSFF